MLGPFHAMCHFITMVLPATTDLDAASKLLGEYGRELSPVENRSIKPLLLPDELYFYPAGESCDCGTALGSLNHASDAGRVEKSWLDGLRKKGWGEAKIARWVEQKKLVGEREERIQSAREADFAGVDPDSWCTITRRLIHELPVSHVGLFVHWYGGSFESEKFDSPQRIELPLDDELADSLFHMEEGILYIISAKPKCG